MEGASIYFSQMGNRKLFGAYGAVTKMRWNDVGQLFFADAHDMPPVSHIKKMPLETYKSILWVGVRNDDILVECSSTKWLSSSESTWRSFRCFKFQHHDPGQDQSCLYLAFGRKRWCQRQFTVAQGEQENSTLKGLVDLKACSSLTSFENILNYQKNMKPRS